MFPAVYTASGFRVHNKAFCRDSLRCVVLAITPSCLSFRTCSQLHRLCRLTEGGILDGIQLWQSCFQTDYHHIAYTPEESEHLKSAIKEQKLLC